MRARNQLGVADELQRPFVRAFDADLREALSHLERALAAAAARGCEAGLQRLVVGVETESDDVHGRAREGHRNFGAVEVGQRERQGGVARTLLAAHLIVIGQRPQLDSVRLGPRRECLGRERSVGHSGVAMQVGVDRRVHVLIVGNEWR